MINKIKKNCIIALILIGIFLLPKTIVNAQEVQKDNIVSLYCWEIEDFNLSKLKDEIEYLKVNTLYIQRPANKYEVDRLKQIMELAKIYNLDVYLLDGAIDWLTTGDINNAKDLIDQAAELNKILDYKLKGVSLDVEYYLAKDYESLSHEEQVELFRTFTAKTKECCDYANRLSLGYTMALPVWFDKVVGDELENLINYNYDHIAFMNYYKETVLDNLNEEVEYARKHDTKIVTITEIQDPKNGNVGEEDTFYNDGLDKCLGALNKIRNKYNYDQLGVSFHYYKPLLDLLKRDTDIEIENRYELEVSPYLNGNNIKIEKATITGNGKTFQPISGYYSESQKNIINFYGLEYGQEYTLNVNFENANAIKKFIYQKDDIDKLEIAYMNIELTNENDSLENDNDKEDSDNNYFEGIDNPKKDSNDSNSQEIQTYKCNNKPCTKEEYYAQYNIPENPQTGTFITLSIVMLVVVLTALRLLIFKMSKKNKIYRI